MKKTLYGFSLALLMLASFRFILFIGYVPTTSMEPTIKRGSFIVGIRIYDEISVGDIVIFQHNNRMLVKRVAACEGDRVISDGEELTVPSGCLYMLGDNAAESLDSRYWDEPYIHTADVIAIVLHPH